MQVKVYIVRTVLSVITLFILTSVCVLTLKFFDGDFETMKFILGTFASGVSLGGVAILTNSICKFSVAGYTVAFGFWLYETTNKYKLIGYKFHILSLFRDSFTEKYYIFAAGIALITTSLIIRNFFRKGILG